MSLLSNYEGLRHQIERLIRENEELKKLVRLIRENHELKSAIKIQAGAMGISGINRMFDEELSGCAAPTSDHIREKQKQGLKYKTFKKKPCCGML